MEETRNLVSSISSFLSGNSELREHIARRRKVLDYQMDNPDVTPEQVQEFEAKLKAEETPETPEIPETEETPEIPESTETEEKEKKIKDRIPLFPSLGDMQDEDLQKILMPDYEDEELTEKSAGEQIEKINEDNIYEEDLREIALGLEDKKYMEEKEKLNQMLKETGEDFKEFQFNVPFTGFTQKEKAIVGRDRYIYAFLIAHIQMFLKSFSCKNEIRKIFDFIQETKNKKIDFPEYDPPTIEFNNNSILVKQKIILDLINRNTDYNTAWNDLKYHIQATKMVLRAPEEFLRVLHEKLVTYKDVDLYTHLCRYTKSVGVYSKSMLYSMIRSLLISMEIQADREYFNKFKCKIKSPDSQTVEPWNLSLYNNRWNNIKKANSFDTVTEEYLQGIIHGNIDNQDNIDNQLEDYKQCIIGMGSNNLNGFIQKNLDSELDNHYNRDFLECRKINTPFKLAKTKNCKTDNPVNLEKTKDCKTDNPEFDFSATTQERKNREKLRKIQDYILNNLNQDIKIKITSKAKF